jgi:hypothetical protein
MCGANYNLGVNLVNSRIFYDVLVFFSFGACNKVYIMHTVFFRVYFVVSPVTKFVMYFIIIIMLQTHVFANKTFKIKSNLKYLHKIKYPVSGFVSSRLHTV